MEWNGGGRLTDSEFSLRSPQNEKAREGGSEGPGREGGEGFLAWAAAAAAAQQNLFLPHYSSSRSPLLFSSSPLSSSSPFALFPFHLGGGSAVQ